MAERAIMQLDQKLADVEKLMHLVHQCYLQYLPKDGLLRMKIFNKNFEFEDVMDDMDNLHTHVNTGIVTVVWLKQAIAGYTSSVKIAQHRFRSDPKFEPRIRRLNPYSIKFFCETLPLQITNIFLETNQLYFYAAISKCVLF